MTVRRKWAGQNFSVWGMNIRNGLSWNLDLEGWPQERDVDDLAADVGDAIRRAARVDEMVDADLYGEARPSVMVAGDL